jgi:peptide/nickel transport system substrate-binding protein
MLLILHQQRYIRLTFVFAVAFVLLVFACTQEESIPTPTPIPSPTPTTTQEPTPIATWMNPDAQHGGTLVIATGKEAPSLDVHQEFSATLAARGPGLVYSRLLRLRSGPNIELPSLLVECELCRSWKIENKGRTYVFQIRDDATWQNIEPTNGRTVTAQDIVSSYLRQATDGWPNAALLNSISSMKADDEKTLRIELEAPDSDFLLSLANGNSKIVAPEVVDITGTLTNGPNIGSGPWVWGGYDGFAYTLQRNTDYFEQGLPYLDALQIHVIADTDTRIAAYRSGLLDVVDIPSDAWTSLSTSTLDMQSLLYLDAGTGMELSLNTARSPFEQLDVRQAFFSALDPWTDIKEVWGEGNASVTLGMPVSSADWLLSREELEVYFNNPSESVKRLEANRENTRTFTLRVGEFGDQYSQHAERIVQALKSVGFQPTIEKVDLKTFSEDVWIDGNYTASLGAVSPSTSPNGYLLSVLHSRGMYNTQNFKDSELDELIESQSVELDPLLRSKQARQIQQRAFEQAFRFMPATKMQRWTWSPRLRDFYPNFAGFEYSFWSKAWLTQ